jgi:exosortase H (IPTLxxWG-CTERM-specific)
MRRSLLFIARFLGLLALFYGAVALPPVNEHLVVPFTNGIAAVSGALLNLMGQHVVVKGEMISSGVFAIAVKNGCNGVEAMVFLCAAMAAFPAPWRRKLLGIAAGIVLIQLLNLVRVITLFLIGLYRPLWFETFHLAVWQSVIAGTTILFFYQWSANARMKHAPSRA